MATVCIGVHVHARPDGLRDTLASLEPDLGPGTSLLLLPDGPDRDTTGELRRLRDLHQAPSQAPLGPPACFNRLAAVSRAEVLVLLESGARVGPGWLERLLAALEADPRNGLAGPSTNRAWNEQAAFRGAGGTPLQVAATAAEAARRFGTVTRTLEPLHSLADFCYAVRRPVVEAIGGADEAYGLGPCWEMDYNLRAARAGFRGVWVCGAYVHRARFTQRRARAEAALFAASRRRYQDKFCGLRLRGARTADDYEPHCLGEACGHFAPPETIPLRLPPPRRRAAAPPRRRGGGPLVSCIMPTGNRCDWALQAVGYFQRQDYPNLELVVVDDGHDQLERMLPADPRIKHVRVPEGTSIGTKRNRACAVAQGTMVIQWDDDDWHGAGRIRRQLGPILGGAADIVALRDAVFFDLDRWQFWTCSSELHRRIFVLDVHGGTLAFRRSVWERLATYPDTSLAEDAMFLRDAALRGARLRSLASSGLFVYLRHGTNSWRLRPGQYADPAGWRQVAEPPLPAADRDFYAARSVSPPLTPVGPLARKKLIGAQAHIGHDPVCE